MLSPTSLRIPPELKERYAQLAESTRRSSHWLMLDALTDYVARKEKKLAFVREAIQAEKHYRETGLHITAEECIDWLDSCGTEEEKDVPKCHK